jgi:hypothetical protein
VTQECELATLCAAPVLDVERIRALLNLPLDWDAVLRFVARNRLQQIFVWRLRQVSRLRDDWRLREPRRDAVPPGLGAAFDETLRNSLQLTRELVKVLDLFRGSGIDALPFKGPTLALEAYGNLALRSFDDLDILVRREDVWRARDALAAAGYTPKVEVRASREEAFLRSYDEFLMRGASGRPLVELHWAFVPPHFGATLNFTECWTRRIGLKLANRELPALAPGDLLVVLAVHGAKHGWSYLGLVADVAWLIASQPLDWAEILGRARHRGILRMTLLAAALVWRTFGTRPDPAVESAIAADPAIEVLCCEITDAIFGLNGRLPHDERAIAASARLHMRMRERTADRIRYALGLAARTGIEDWEAVDLPDALSFLYPALRGPRLAIKYFKASGISDADSAPRRPPRGS